MVTLTAFADEISPNLDAELNALESENIHALDLRAVWGKNVLRLDDEELERMQAELDRRGFRLSSVASPIGKVLITDDFEGHLRDLERAVSIAQRFHTPFIRIFSFYIPSRNDPAAYRDEVLRRMKEMSHRAEQAGVILLHENEKDIYGDTPERCREILQACASPSLRCAFDPANFVQVGIRPFEDAYPLLEPYIEYVHIKDARWGSGEVVPAGEGDGQVASFLATLQRRGYSGFLSLEPHLAAAGPFSGFSGPDLFHVAAQALKRILEELGWGIGEPLDPP